MKKHTLMNDIQCLHQINMLISVYNQDRVRKCGGLEVIISVIQRLGNQIRRHPQYLSLALHVVTTLDACIADNGRAEENLRLALS